MADIQQNLENIKSAIYGEEVRGSIRDAIESMNDELVSTTAGLEAATDAANASAANANVAADSANNAASAANAAAGLANTAAGSANAAAQNADATASRAGKVLEDCTTATGAANTATINANAAAGSAASAAGSASAAAQNAADFANAAQQAASDANDASAAANTAAARANAAANNAENIGGVSEKTVEFIEASERKNIESGEDVKTVFGKVKKWFSSLGTAAFATVSNVLNVESPGYVMDARQGKVLKDLIDVLEAGVGDLTALETTDKDNLVSAINNLSTAISSLNNKTIRLAELSYGDAGHEFSLSSAENKKYHSYVIAAKPRNTGFPWAYAITKNGSSSGVNYFYSASYYFSLSATISDDKISFSKTWSKGVNNGSDISLSDIDVYVYGLE